MKLVMVGDKIINLDLVTEIFFTDGQIEICFITNEQYDKLGEDESIALWDYLLESPLVEKAE